LYLDSIGYGAYIIPEQKGIHVRSFAPYIFTHKQIHSLIKEMDSTKPWEGSKNMYLALPVIFRLLYGCGLRVSEVCNLQFRDVNLDAGILTIREPKNCSDKYIPLSDSVKEACIAYADHIWLEKDNEYFFMAPGRTRISPMTIYQRYHRYLLAAGISHGGKRHGPKLHDLRHTFTVHVLQKWITEGADLAAMMSILSTYMGHKGIRSTAQYLRLTAKVYLELMKKVESSCSYVIPEVFHEGN
jgi:integrase/recombinase XerD